MIVAGSVGPTGELLVPLGALTYDEAVEAFAEQIEGLKAGGAEVAWIETMSAPEEIRAAAEAAIRRRPALHLHRLVRHCRPHHDGAAAEGHSRRRRRAVIEGLLGVGANCGVGASDILAFAARHDRGTGRRRPSSSRAIAAFPNSAAPRSTIPAHRS